MMAIWAGHAAGILYAVLNVRCDVPGFLSHVYSLDTIGIIMRRVRSKHHVLGYKVLLCSSVRGVHIATFVINFRGRFRIR
jgi:xanthosine utilization system XapX-like protein